jgi:hypothetical protein
MFSFQRVTFTRGYIAGFGQSVLNLLTAEFVLLSWNLKDLESSCALNAKPEKISM